MIKAYSNELSDTIDKELNEIDFDKLNEVLSFNGQFIFNDISFLSVVKKIINGDLHISYESLLSNIVTVFLNKFYQLLPAVAIISAIAILTAIIEALGAFSFSAGIKNTVCLVCYCSAITLILGITESLIINVEKSLKNLNNLIEIMSPVMSALLISTGANTSASIYQPTVIFLTNTIANVYLYFIMPLITFMVVFSVIGNFSDKIKIKKFAEFFQSMAKWVIGLFSAIFGLLMTVQGITASTIDGMSVKALKYTVTGSVPIVGNLVGGSLDMIFAGAIIIKSAVGYAGILLTFSIVISPLFAIISMQLFLKLLSAVLESFCGKSLLGFIDSLSKSLNYLTAVTISFALMIFVLLFIMVLSANIMV